MAARYRFAAEQRANRIVQHINPTSATPAATKQPITITLTGAAGNIAYSLLWQICLGHMLGPDQPIVLRLLEIPRMVNNLRAVIHELQDSNLPLLHSITGTTDFKTAFDQTDIALLLGGKPKVPGSKRKQILQANSHIFSAQGAALNAYAKRDVKVIVLATPALTNCLICQQNAPDIPAHNFTALTRLDQNRATHQLALRLNVNVTQVQNVVIFGNGSKTQLPYVQRATVTDNDGITRSINEAVNDDKWLRSEYINDCVDRGHIISKTTHKTTAGSAATATIMHMRDWLYGTPDGQYVSMAVRSDGSYGVPKDLFFSFPCQCTGAGRYRIISDLPIDAFGLQRLKATIQELQTEKQLAHVD